MAFLYARCSGAYRVISSYFLYGSKIVHQFERCHAHDWHGVGFQRLSRQIYQAVHLPALTYDRERFLHTEPFACCPQAVTRIHQLS
jgi:hypothetical protein